MICDPHLKHLKLFLQVTNPQIFLHLSYLKIFYKNIKYKRNALDELWEHTALKAAFSHKGNDCYPDA